MSTMYTIRHGYFTMSGENLRQLIMLLAHAIRREAASTYRCETKEILFSECLKMAWEAGKKATAIDEYKTPSEILLILKSAKKRGERFTEWEEKFLDSFTARRKNFSYKQESTLVRMFLERPYLRTAA